MMKGYELYQKLQLNISPSSQMIWIEFCIMQAINRRMIISEK